MNSQQTKTNLTRNTLVNMCCYITFILLGFYYNPLFYYGVTFMVFVLSIIITLMYILVYVYADIIPKTKQIPTLNVISYYINILLIIFMIWYMYSIEFKITAALFLYNGIMSLLLRDLVLKTFRN